MSQCELREEPGAASKIILVVLFPSRIKLNAFESHMDSELPGRLKVLHRGKV